MKWTNVLLIGLIGASFAACGDGPSVQNNGKNNGANNGSNNGSNNGANNGSNNGVNNGSNNGVNNGVNNGTTGSNNGTTGTNNGTTGTNNGTTGTNNGTTGTNNGTTGTNNGTTGTNNGTGGTCNGSLGPAEACGGDPTGTWTLDEICTDYDYGAAIQQACAQATASEPTFTGSGTLVVAGNSWAYDVMGEATIDATIPQNCNFLGCNQTAELLKSSGGAKEATCTDNGSGGCDCSATYDASQMSAGTYTTDGNGTATISSGETYYYCVMGGTLQLREYGTNNDDVQPSYLLSK